MASWDQHKFLNGILLPEFCTKTGVEATAENVKAVKDMFKRYFHIPLTRRLTNIEMNWFINKIVMLTAREFGIMLTLPEEYHMDIESMSMTDFLAFHLNKH